MSSHHCSSRVLWAEGRAACEIPSYCFLITFLWNDALNAKGNLFACNIRGMLLFDYQIKQEDELDSLPKNQENIFGTAHNILFLALLFFVLLPGTLLLIFGILAHFFYYKVIIFNVLLNMCKDSQICWQLKLDFNIF